MASFFEKLKKGMGVEEPLEDSAEEEIVKKEPPKSKKPRMKKIKKMEKKRTKLEEPVKEPAEEESEEEEENDGEIKVEKKEATPEQEEKEKWFETEGQLAIDVYQTENELVIQSAVAGVGIEKLDIFLEKDVLSIKGARQKPYEERGDYFFQECFWGQFSREVILPAEVDPDKVLARMKDGILTIRIPKILREKKRKITVSS